MRVNLFRRGRVWHGQWSITKGGACVACGESFRVHRHSTECTDKEAAKAVAARWERLAADPTYRAAKTTLERAASRFLTEMASTGCAEATAEMYECKARHVVRVLGPSLPVAQVDAPAVDTFIATRRAEGASSSTIYKELCALRGILRSAARRGEYPREPRSVMPLRFRVGYTPRRRFLSLAELARVCACLPPNRAAFVRFIVATGARLGEVVRAERSDVQRSAVWLRSTKRRVGNGAAVREVPITAIARPLLDLALEEADGEGAALFSAWPCVHRDLRAACERSGVAVVIPNDLRRTFASLHLQAGAAEEHVSRAMGHASTAMLRKVYGVVPSAELGRLIDGAAVAVETKERLVQVDRVKCPACDGVGVRHGMSPSRPEPCERCGASGYVGVWDVEGAREMAEQGQNVPGGVGEAGAPRSGGPSRSRTGSQRIKSPIASGVETRPPYVGAQGVRQVSDSLTATDRRIAMGDPSVRAWCVRMLRVRISWLSPGEDVPWGTYFRERFSESIVDIENGRAPTTWEMEAAAVAAALAGDASFPEDAGVLDAIAATARIGKLGERSGDREVVIGTLRGMADRLGMRFAPGAVRHATENGHTAANGESAEGDGGCDDCAAREAREGGSR